MYPQYKPISQTPPESPYKGTHSQHCTHADTQHMVVCHCDADVYNQRSLLLLLYSFVYFQEQQLRCVSIIIFFHLIVCGRQGTSWYLMGTIRLHFTHRPALLFVCGTFCCFTWKKEPGRRLSMRKGLCGTEGVRSDSAGRTLTHLMPESWQPLLKPCAKGSVRPP